MKLYYSPGACSLAPHIVACEAGLPLTLVRVDLATHTLADGGADFYAINSKGYVPVLEFDDGQRLTEAGVVMEYLADQAPQKQLAPTPGTLPRYRLLEWMNFLATEIHKGIGTLFNKALSEADRKLLAERAVKRLQWIDKELAGRTHLFGDGFSIADAYLFTTTNWCAKLGIDLAPMANLVAWRAAVAQRPAVQQAMREEGLLK